MKKKKMMRAAVADGDPDAVKKDKNKKNPRDIAAIKTNYKGRLQEVCQRKNWALPGVFIARPLPSRFFIFSSTF